MLSNVHLLKIISITIETNCLSDATISAIDIEDKDILKIIWALQINKAHDHDNILTHMIKICNSTTVKTLSIIFHNSLNSKIFPNNWKRSNMVAVHKKGNKQLTQNYCLASVLPISSEISERFLFNLLYKFVEQNCFSQLMWIHEN